MATKRKINLASFIGGGGGGASGAKHGGGHGAGHAKHGGHGAGHGHTSLVPHSKHPERGAVKATDTRPGSSG